MGKHYQPGDRHRGYGLGGGAVHRPFDKPVSLHPAAHEAYHVCIDGRHYDRPGCRATDMGLIDVPDAVKRLRAHHPLTGGKGWPYGGLIDDLDVLLACYPEVRRGE